jgi:hypothetical protein
LPEEDIIPCLEKVVLNIEEVIPEILRTGIDEIDAKYKVVE